MYCLLDKLLSLFEPSEFANLNLVAALPSLSSRPRSRNDSMNLLHEQCVPICTAVLWIQRYAAAASQCLKITAFPLYDLQRLGCAKPSKSDLMFGKRSSHFQHICAYRVIMSEKPSTHCPNEPETPAMLYPRGGINVCLYRSGVSEYIQQTA